MGAVRSVIARSWFPVLAGFVGYPAFGLEGTIVGMGLAALLQMSWQPPGARNEVWMAHLRSTAAHYQGTDPSFHAVRSLLTTNLVLVAYAAVVLVYSIVIGITRESIAFAGWMKTFQPAVDWLAAFIPALRQMPSYLIEHGYPDLALAIQHMLFVGWSLSLPVAVWIILDVLVIHRHAWNRLFSLENRSELAKVTLSAAVMVALAISFLFLGWWWTTAFAQRTLGGGILQLLLLAIFFVAAMFFFFGLIGLCNAFLLRSFSKR